MAPEAGAPSQHDPGSPPGSPFSSEAPLPPRKAPHGLGPDLRPRLIAGLAMALVAVVFAYAGTVPFALLVVLVAMLMCWEWGRVVRGEEFGTSFSIHAGAVAAGIALAAAGRPALALAAVIIGVAMLLVLGPARRRWVSAGGVAYVGLPAIAMVWMRSDAVLGFHAVLFIFIIVWSSDIAAFVAGRSIGGARLWPRVSPNKTWAGFLGGLAAGVVCGGAFALLVPGGSSAALATMGLMLAFVAQMGDLAESALKRGYGVKDSSAIIPGHGGVMDRADSTVAVSVVAAVIALLIDAAAPARALLVGL